MICKVQPITSYLNFNVNIKQSFHQRHLTWALEYYSLVMGTQTPMQHEELQCPSLQDFISVRI